MDRRSFLKWAGALGIGLSPLVLAAPVREKVFGRGLQAASKTRPLMGTWVTVTVLHPSEEKAAEAMERAFAEMERLSPLLDRHGQDTPVAYLNRTARLQDVPRELHEVLARSERFYRLTGGVFDITVKPVLDLLETHFSRTKEFPQAEEIRRAASRVGAQSIAHGEREIRFLREGMGVTLDGIAKGYIVDRAISFLKDFGIRQALINAGGDIRALGDKGNGQPWRIAIQDPMERNQVVQVIPLREGAVATSGDYENYFDPEKKFHHIIDPETGFSPHRFTSVSILAPSLADADALATAAFIPSRDRAMKFIAAVPGTQVLWIDREKKRAGSGGWPSA